jgi:hypothetical protein
MKKAGRVLNTYASDPKSKYHNYGLVF